MDLETNIQPDLSKYGITSDWLPAATTPPRTLLAIFAHPDDETFGTGGTLARYAASGVKVHYACATRGELGTVPDELRAKYADLATLRSEEMDCAAQTLGLSAVHYLGYRDSGMPGTPDNSHPQSLHMAPLDQVVKQLVALIRTLQPQVILTFGPFGGYGHPDHIKMYQAAEAAFKVAADPDYSHSEFSPWQTAKLYYTTFPTTTLKWGVRAFKLIGKDPTRFGVNKDVDLVETLKQATPVTTVINCGDFLEVSDKAALCHRSQLGEMSRALRIPLFVRRIFTGKEHYTLAIPKPSSSRTEHDLFEGLYP
ncbi:MAG TPA: PIG-L family deacetylase [Chloroflexia bacterium]|nr:PIG-L family deacetylase [Chloroflexia bacterium]